MGIYHNVWLNYSARDTVCFLQMHRILGNANSAVSLPFHMVPNLFGSLRVIPTEQFLKWDCSRQCEKRHLRRTKRTKLARWTTNNSCFSGSSSTESHIWSISPCSRLPLIMDASFSPIGVLQGTNSPSQPPTLLHCGSHHWLSRLGTGLSLYIISLSDLLLLLV